MNAGDLENIGFAVGNPFKVLEKRIMEDIVDRIRDNGFSTATANWEVTRLQQLGHSKEEIKKWAQEALEATDEQIEEVFSSAVYNEYYGHAPAYEMMGKTQVPFEENASIQSLISAVKTTLKGEYNNLANSMGFVERDASGRIVPTPLNLFYRHTMDNAVLDIQSGVYSYEQVVEKTIKKMTASGLRYVNYESGHSDRVDVAARRAIFTGLRQVQAKINEQTAAELGTDYYEVTWHAGSRPSHMPWQGKVWSYQELIDVCGLGDVTGLNGANCYHNYDPFIPGVSVRTYSDEWLKEQNERELTPRDYYGKQYTTYEALQRQRELERNMRKCRQDASLLRQAGCDDQAILSEAKYHGLMAQYTDFSDKMGLPMQKERIFQDGLGNVLKQSRVGASSIGGGTLWDNYNENAKFNIKTPMYSDKINQTINECCKDVIVKGHADKFEHGYTIDSISGEVKYYTNHATGDVFDQSFFEYIKDKPAKSIITVHNHSANDGFSYIDMSTFANNDALGFNVAACHDGGYYAVGDKIKDLVTGSAFSEDEAPGMGSFIDELRKQMRDGTIMINEFSRKRESMLCEEIAQKYFNIYEVVKGDK